MKRLLLIFILQTFVTAITYSQSFTVHDLIGLSTMQPAAISSYMYKKGFIPDKDNTSDSITSYIQKFTKRKAERDTLKSIDLYEKHSSKYFVLHSSSPADYEEGRKSLLKSKFVYNTKKDISKDPSIVFQKANISVESTMQVKDTLTNLYTFTLQEKKIPDSVYYAEDLLQFDSREFLVSYFGERNVRNDLYYFSEKELKKCSVLFGGGPHQAVFIWGNEDDLDSLSYIIVSNVLPTKSGQESGITDESNDWKFKSGVRWGMPVRDMLRLNEMDFYLYGNTSDLALTAKPEITGKINFKKTGIMFKCDNCADNAIFRQDEVSALDIAKANLALQIFSIIMYP